MTEACAGPACSVCGGRARIDVSKDAAGAAGAAVWRCGDHAGTWQEPPTPLAGARVKVYVAGPYTKGDVAVNVHAAVRAANDLADRGFAPFVPHLTHFWHLLFPRPYEFWLDLDNQFLPQCDAVLRLAGLSSGADAEAALARNLGIPVFCGVAEINAHFAKRIATP